MSTAIANLDIPGSGRIWRFARRRLLGLVSPALQRWAQRHYATERIWRYDGLEFAVWPGVFPPGPTLSTAFTLGYLGRQDLEGAVVAEVGCGTGALGIFAARKGAKVHACDINPLAVANTNANGLRNGCTIDAIKGNLLEPFVGLSPDLILITPPYYPKDPKDLVEAAWFCGIGHSYFHALFTQLGQPEFAGSRTLMNLSEDCDIETILAIARLHGLSAEVAHARRVWGEWLYIFAMRQEAPGAAPGAV
jgi:release factor glutamine methyltransferase